MKSTDGNAANAGMSISRRRFIELGGAVGVGGMLLALAGCGEASQGSGATGTSGGAQAGSSAAKASASSEGKKVRVVTNNSTRPYCYADENGDLVGYDIATLKLVQDKLGGSYDFSFDALQFTAMIGALQSGAGDVASCSLSRTEERVQKFLLPDEPYGLAPMVLAHRAEDKFEKLSDMAGRTLRCNAMLAEYQAVRKYNEEHPDAQIVINDTDPIVSDADLFRAVANGQADGVLIFKGGFDAANQGAGTNLVATEPVLVNALYFLLRKDEQELCDAISGALAKAKQDGSLGEVGKQWLGEDVFATYDFPKGADIVVDGGEVVYSLAEDGVFQAASSAADGEVRAGSASSSADRDRASSSRD